MPLSVIVYITRSQLSAHSDGPRNDSELIYVHIVHSRLYHSVALYEQSHLLYTMVHCLYMYVTLARPQPPCLGSYTLDVYTL